MTDSNATPSFTKLANYKRLIIAGLIDNGVNTVPALEERMGIPKRTIEKALKNLSDFDIIVKRVGADRNGWYEIESWGFVDRKHVKTHLSQYLSILKDAA